MAFDQQKFDGILARYAEGGIGLRGVCKEFGVSHSHFLSWVEADVERQNLYARAREAADEIDFDNLQKTADELPPKDDKGRIDNGWVAWKRLQVDTMKWALAKRRPSKYGDKVTTELVGANGGPVQMASIDPSTLTEEQLRVIASIGTKPDSV